MQKLRDSKTSEKEHKSKLNQSIESRSKKFYSGEIFTNKWKYIRSEVNHMFKNYCETTTMHGFRNIAARLPYTEKCIWVAICFAAATFCLILMQFSYQNNNERLTLIQLTSRNTPLYSLNFPAVTICNYNKVYQPASAPMERTLLVNEDFCIYMYLYALSLLHLSEIFIFFFYKFEKLISEAGYIKETINAFFRNLSLLTQPHYQPFEAEIFNKMIYLLDNNLKNLMLRLMQPCDKLLKSCWWVGKSYNCSLLFKVVDSFLGHCCGFNYQVATTYADENYSPECLEFYKKFDPDNKLSCKANECPGRKEILKTPGTGSDAGLTVDLDVEQDMYTTSIRHYMGAAIIIHEAHDYPETDIQTATVQPDQSTRIVVSASEILSLDDIRLYSPAERQCVFSDELGFEYSYQSCIAGCKMNRILKVCNCIPYYYPETCTNISRTCDLKDVRCLQKNLDKMTKLYEDVTIDGQVLKKCECKQVCHKTLYKISIDKNRINHPNYSLPWKKINSTNNKTSRLKVHFQDYGYTQYTRRLYTAWNDKLANLGGLLGVCLGGSLISIIEPLIYFLLTPFRRAHHRKIRQAKEAKKIAEEESKDQFKNFPPARKLFKSVPLDEKLLKEWQKNRNNIFNIGGGFNIPEKRQRSKRHTEKKSISQDVNLFRTHFL